MRNDDRTQLGVLHLRRQLTSAPEVRTEVEWPIKRRKEERGVLLAIVQIRVYENDEEPQVSFSEDALLGVETDSSIISDVVARAREQLVHWR